MLRSSRWPFAAILTVVAVLPFFILLVVLGFGSPGLVVSTALFSPVYFLFFCALWGVIFDRNSSWIPWLVVAVVVAGSWVFISMDILVYRIGVGIHPMVLRPVVAFLTSSLCFGLFYPLFRTRGE